MKKINIFLYAYKNKKLQNIVDLLISKSSKQNVLFFDIYDKDNEDKRKQYSAYPNLKYTHIFWDHKNAGPYYRNKSIDNVYDYFFDVGNLQDICQDWDKVLVDMVDNDLVSIPSNLINMGFIFTTKNNAHILKQLSLLKFYGQDLFLYYLLNKNNIKIKTFSGFCALKKDTVLESDYVPYSLYQNYNTVIDLVKSDLDFIESHKIRWDIYKRIPFIVNDIDYTNIVHNLDQQKSEKFHKPIKTIKRIYDGV